MKIKIEIVASYSNYSRFTWTKEDQQNYGNHPNFKNEWDMELLKQVNALREADEDDNCLLYTSPSPRDVEESRMPSSA